MKKSAWTFMSAIALERVISDIYILKAKVQNWYFLKTDLQKS